MNLKLINLTGTFNFATRIVHVVRKYVTYYSLSGFA